MQFRILGPLEVSVDECRLDLGGTRQQLVLAGLLLGTGRTVSLPELIELVWNEGPPPTARAQIQTMVYRLRRLLNRHDHGGHIHTDAAGYRIEIGADQLDLTRFEAATTAARNLAAGGDLVSAVAALREALALWRGLPLQDLPGAALARRTERLNELRVAATEDRVSAELTLGGHRELIPELSAQVAENPLNERSAAALMIALHRSGRQADALRVYRRTVGALREELGIDPGPELRQRHIEVLRGSYLQPADEQPPPVVDRTPDAVSGPKPRCLPGSAARLVGRTEEIDKVVRAVRDCEPARSSIVVVDGMAGVGKSALAVEIVRRLGSDYPDAHLFLDLQGHSEQAPLTPHAALAVLIGQLGAAGRIPDDLPSRIALWRSLLAGRRTIVVLDNAAGTAQIEALLPGDAACLVLVTSRTAIGLIDAVCLLSLEPLGIAHAVEVLREVVGDRVDREPVAAVEVAELCGRLPLAVRMVAHRLHHRPHWSITDLVERLRAADPSPIEIAAEGRTVAAAFEVSYRQLTEPQQRLFRLLGLHPAAPFEVWPAAALAELSVAETSTMLDSLVEVHLVQAGAPSRYHLHDLLRAFAASLVSPAERASAIIRMFDYYLYSTAEAVDRGYDPGDRDHLTAPPGMVVRKLPSQAARLAWARAEWPTIVTLADLAHQSGAHRYAGLLPRAIWHFADYEGHGLVMERLCRQGLASATCLGDDHLAAMLHRIIAGTYLRLGRGADSLTHLSRAALLYERGGDTKPLVQVHLNLGLVQHYTGQLLESMQSNRIARSLATAAGDANRELSAATGIGATAICLGHYDTALSQLRYAAARLRRLGSPNMFGIALSELGRVHLALNHPRLAVLLFCRSIRIKQENGNFGGVTETLSCLGRAHGMLGDATEALRYQRQAQEQLRKLGDNPVFESIVANDVGRTLTQLGRTDEALIEHHRALAVAERIQHRYEQARAHAGIAAASERAGLDGAGTAQRAAYEMFRSMGLEHPAALDALLR